MVTFFEEAGVEKKNEEAADRRSGQCPRNSEQLHLGVEGDLYSGLRQPYGSSKGRSSSAQLTHTN